jgi:hypothetical protein
LVVSDKSRIIFIIVVCILIVAIVFTKDSSNAPSKIDAIGQAANAAYPNFETTINGFNSPNNLDFSSTDTQKIFAFTVSDDAVYRTAYISINGTAWQPITLTGNILSVDWLQKNTVGTYTIQRIKVPDDIGTDNYLIIYTCTRSTVTWNCHGNRWQIKNFNTTKTAASSTVIEDIILGTDSPNPDIGTLDDTSVSEELPQ